MWVLPSPCNLKQTPNGHYIQRSIFKFLLDSSAIINFIIFKITSSFLNLHNNDYAVFQVHALNTFSHILNCRQQISVLMNKIEKPLFVRSHFLEYFYMR